MHYFETENINKGEAKMEYEMKAGDIYKHFKGNRYEIVAVAQDCEDGSPQVVYKALYPPYTIYVRPYHEFVEELDKAKYPKAEQKHRFEKETAVAGERKFFGNLPGLGKTEGEASETTKATEPVRIPESVKTAEPARAPETGRSRVIDPNAVSDEKTESTAGARAEQPRLDDRTESGRISVERKVDKNLLLFLNGNTFEEQIAVLKEMRGRISEEMFAVMFASLDFPMPNGDEDSRYNALMKRLETMHEFDGKRFRI